MNQTKTIACRVNIDEERQILILVNRSQRTTSAIRNFFLLAAQDIQSRVQHDDELLFGQRTGNQSTSIGE